MAASGDINIAFDQDMLAKIQKKLGAMKSQAPKVLKMALNDTARKARSDLAKKAQETYAIKTSGLTKRVRMQYANVANLEAVLRINGKPLTLSKQNFSVQGGHGPKGPRLKTTVLKDYTHTWKSRAFQNKIASGGPELVATYAGKEGKGDGRLPIRVRYTTSIPQMFGNKRRVYGVVEPNIQKNLQESVERHIKRILEE